jgi:O-antigen biosynthesis protein WbqP
VNPVYLKNSKRTFDLIFAVIVLTVFAVAMIVISLMVKLTSKGPVLHWSNRVGRCNLVFQMPKFRTMRVDAPTVATHLLKDPFTYLTPLGRFLRKFSLDELPQLWSVLKGDMSFVGPRPALYNQDDLIELRRQNGLHKLMPGITGWAQVNGRDNLTVFQKVEYDEYYMNHRSFAFDFKILLLTLGKVIRTEDISH